ncbi:MarR family transcriptional regulator [Ligilactobacillus salitolerans]|uniref:MarR family transcriptional regulator n=1 Tax=Ligilactobacillus salitolerans TaxID=1808352 RepID=A0A401IWG9_9LACO|nr:MarR family transcriptional regulator [Ligilactobacillus salitolerans]GBG95884.1 MarR family transcriptional regulator [Ligilactobacillus salitolerans]
MKESLAALIDVQRNYQQILKKMTKKHSLTIAEWQLMQNISDGNQTQTQLVAVTQLDVSTLSRQLGRLVEKKLLAVEKLEEKGAARKKYLYQLTDVGRKAFEDMQADFFSMSQDLFGPWTKEEQNLLKILLNRLKTSFERI